MLLETFISDVDGIDCLSGNVIIENMTLFVFRVKNTTCYVIHNELEDTATYVEREDFLETWENLISMVQSDAGPIPTSFSARIRNL